jgi:ribonuclease P protein component
MRHTFRKTERLTGKKRIAGLHRSGVAVKEYPFVCIYQPVEFIDDSPAKLVISVPKRRVRKAVNRNKIKRRIREAYRQHKHPLYEALKSATKQWAILLIFVGDEEVSQKNVNEKISRLTDRLCKVLHADLKQETDE